jgi:hypothetical protein
MKMYRAVKDNDEGVFRAPMVEGKDVSGYKLVNEYFVDNSGFGAPDELAMMPSIFLSKVKAGFYYAITGAGQFQVYIGEFEKKSIKGKKALAEIGITSRKKIASNTYDITYTDERRVIRLHATDIITFKGEKMILNSGGYHTHTTKARLALFCGIYQKAGKWYVAPFGGKFVEFFDGIEI